jgi:hypothetical protein
MKCYQCFTEMVLDGIGYVCDPPHSSKFYYYKCQNCGHEDAREVEL